MADILRDGIDPDITWESQPMGIMTSWWCADHEALELIWDCHCVRRQKVEVRVYEV